MIFTLATVGSLISYFILYDNNMSVGLFAPQDINIFALWLNKSYTKLTAVALGLFLARLYLDVREAKVQGKESFERYKKASVCRSSWVAIPATLICYGVLGAVGYAPRSANKDPPSWSRQKSAVFITLSRPTFLLCLICIFYVLFLNHCKPCKTFLARRFWAVLARLAYGTYLIFPVFSGQFASSMGSPLYLTYNEMFYQMIFSILGSVVAAAVIYLFWERPIVHLIYGHNYEADSEQAERRRASRHPKDYLRQYDEDDQ